MLWWLAIVFGGLAALGVVLATKITQPRSYAALRQRAADVAAAGAFSQRRHSVCSSMPERRSVPRSHARNRGRD